MIKDVSQQQFYFVSIYVSCILKFVFTIEILFLTPFEFGSVRMNDFNVLCYMLHSEQQTSNLEYLTVGFLKKLQIRG